jgi:hypothetical protein
VLGGFSVTVGRPEEQAKPATTGSYRISSFPSLVPGIAAQASSPGRVSTLVTTSAAAPDLAS